MRVYMTRSERGEVDGIQLATFQVGLTYDVPATLATYLITSGLADPVTDEAPALIVPVAEVRVVVNPEPVAVAADAGPTVDTQSHPRKSSGRKPVARAADSRSLH